MSVLVLVLVLLIIASYFIILVYHPYYTRKKVSEAKGLIRFLDDGISLAESLKVEFGLLKARSYHYGRCRSGYSVEFLARGSGLVDKIKYSDLCSDPYLLATDRLGYGYLVAAGAKIVSRKLRNVVILCLDPSRIPELSKSIEGQEGVRSEISLKSGRYIVKASWMVGALPRWRVVYDERKGVYAIAIEPEKGRVRSATVKLCVREICSSVLKIEKPGEEVVREVGGLSERKIIVQHLSAISLTEIASSLGATAYPYISGYAPGMVKMKLVHDIPLARDVVVEEVI